MKIDLNKLGLGEEATIAEVLAKVNELGLMNQDEVTEIKDAAAAGARKAALAKMSKSTLTEEELKEYNSYKIEKKKETLLSNTVLKKFNSDDFDLIVKANKLMDLEGDELDKTIDEIAKTEAKRMTNDLPEEVNDGDGDNADSDLPVDVDDF